MGRLKRGKRNIVLGLAALTAVGVFASVLSTVAWFAANSKVGGNNMAIILHTDNLTGTQMKSYSVTNIDGNQYTFINHESYTLPRFDPSNIDYTEYEKALVFRVNFFCKEEKNYIIKAHTTEGFHTNTEIETQDFDHLSNCAEFFIGQSTTVINPDTFESAVVEVTTSASFVSISNGVVSKVQEITIANINATVGENVIYVVMQYNTPVIEYINLIRQSNPTPITYLNDISFEFEEVE